MRGLAVSLLVLSAAPLSLALSITALSLDALLLLEVLTVARLLRDDGRLVDVEEDLPGGLASSGLKLLLVGVEEADSDGGVMPLGFSGVIVEVLRVGVLVAVSLATGPLE